MTRLGRFLSVTAFAGVFVIPAIASADVVGPPPPTCPAGSVPDACHGGPFCRPNFCMRDDECRPDEVCMDTTLCIGTIDCGGQGGPSPADTVEEPCEPGGGCRSDRARCEAAKVCGVPGGGSTGGSSGGGTATASTTRGTSADGGTTNGDEGGGEGGVANRGCDCRSETPTPLAFVLSILVLGLVRRSTHRVVQ